MKRLLAAALAAAAMLAAPAMAQDKASLRFNWYLGGLHVPFYLGKERGYYAAEGIDLTLNEGRGSANTVQVVAAGSDTFGMADGGSLMLLASRGAEIKAVMSILSTGGFAVISKQSAGIKAPKDLEGKRLAVTAGDALTQLFPAVVKYNRLDMSKIQLIQVDPAGKVVSVLEDRADALLGGADDQFFLIEAKGHKASALRFADNGANTVGMTIFAQEATLRDKPDMVRRFARATQRAWQASRAEPDAAVNAALKTKPDLNFQSTKNQLLVDLDLMESPASKGKGAGFNAPEDWERTKALLTEYRDLKTDKPATAFYTNDFLPK